jgi:hypothetical protein
MDTFQLIERRLEKALDRVNFQRQRADTRTLEHGVVRDPLRMDLDIIPRGIMSPEDFYFRVREQMRFEPLMTIKVGVRGGAYYFDVDSAKYGSDLYKQTKVPPNRSHPNESFWLASELDTPLDAIEKHMLESLK